jgi:hypothetical protein
LQWAITYDRKNLTKDQVTTTTTTTTTKKKKTKTTTTTTTTTNEKIICENIVRQIELEETSWYIPLHQSAFKTTVKHFVSGSYDGRTELLGH